MKFSESTKTLLKNFAGINSGIVISPGSEISTLGSEKDVYAHAGIAETFDENVAFYDLQQFLSVLNGMNDPEVEFGDTNARIHEGKQVARIAYTSPDNIVHARKEPNVPDVVGKITLPATVFADLVKMSSILGLTLLRIEPHSVDAVSITAVNPKTDDGKLYSVTVPATYRGTFKFEISLDKLKLLPGNYEIEVTKNKHAKIINTDEVGKSNLYYLVVMKSTSTYEDVEG